MLGLSQMAIRPLWHRACEVQTTLTAVSPLPTTVQMLTAQQEARLEAASFPWCPDFWEMTNLLAAKHKQPPPPLLTDLEVTGPALRPLLPLNAAFQFLTKPLMTRGLGMRLKRMCLSSLPFPGNTQERSLTRVTAVSSRRNNVLMCALCMTAEWSLSLSPQPFRSSPSFSSAAALGMHLSAKLSVFSRLCSYSPLLSCSMRYCMP